MKKELYDNDTLKLAVVTGAQIALKTYRTGLKTKLYIADTALAGMERYMMPPAAPKTASGGKPAICTPQTTEKETKDMKRLIGAFVMLAAAGAAVGAAGYYLYKKTNPDENYEDLLIEDEMGEEFEIVDQAYAEPVEDAVAAVADVADVVASAAENVADTVKDAYEDVKEAIDGALE